MQLVNGSGVTWFGYKMNRVIVVGGMEMSLIFMVQHLCKHKYTLYLYARILFSKLPAL